MRTSLISKLASTIKRIATHSLDEINLYYCSYNKAVFRYYSSYFFNLILLTLFLGASCSNKSMDHLKNISCQSHIASQNTLQKSRLPLSLGFVPDWNINNIALSSDISKISDIPQNWQYFEPINDDLICYYYKRTNNPKSFFPNLPNDVFNDNEYEAWLWDKKQKKVLDIRTGGIEPCPSDQIIIDLASKHNCAIMTAYGTDTAKTRPQTSID